jgi:pilus assembly protein Flp/PilA
MDLKTTFDVFATWMKARFESERGATLVEYALLVALIAVACIVAVQFLSSGAQGTLNSAGSKLGTGS